MKKILQILNKDLGDFSTGTLVCVWIIYTLVISIFTTSIFILVSFILFIKLKLGLITLIFFLFWIIQILFALSSIIPNFPDLFQNESKNGILKNQSQKSFKELNEKSLIKIEKLKKFMYKMNKKHSNFKNLEFVFISDDTIQAWVRESLKDTKIYWTTELINSTPLNQLKFVYLHEYKHITQFKSLKFNLLKIIYYLIPFKIGSRAFSRMKEKDADLFSAKHKGLLQAGIIFFKKWYKLEQIKLKKESILKNFFYNLILFKTHPPIMDRIKYLNQSWNY